MFDQLMKMFNGKTKSKSVAKSRLQLILIQDRIGINEEVMKNLQMELTELLGKYFELEPDHVEMDLHREEESMALVANIPIFGMKRTLSVQPQPQIQTGP